MLLRLSSSATKHPAIWIALWTALTLLCALGLLRLQIRTDGATIYPDHNETIRRTEADRLVFRDPDEVILLLTSQPGGEPLASPAGLRFVQEIHKGLEQQAGVERRGVRSLASLPIPPAGDDALSGAQLLDAIPTKPAEFAELLRTIRDHPLADGLFLSADGEAAALYVQIETDQEPAELIKGLETWIASQVGCGFDLRLMGPLVAETTLGGIVLGDLGRLVPIMMIAITIMLFLLLRTAGGIIVPLLKAGIVLIWTIGMMGHCGVPVTLVTTVLPVIPMAMAITDEVHILERLHTFMASREEEGIGPPTERDRLRQAVGHSLGAVGTPIIMTTLTTALGFLSFLSASMSPMRQFGLFAAFGIFLAMVLSFTLIPALIVILPASWFRRRQEHNLRPGFLRRTSGERTSIWQREGVWLLGPLLLLLALPGLLRLSVQDAWLDNFDSDSPLVTAQKTFDRKFWGSYRFDVVFQGDKGFFLRPEGVEMIEEFIQEVSGAPGVGGILSYLTPLRPVAQALGGTTHLGRLSSEQITDVITVTQMSIGHGEMDRLLVQDGSSARVRLFVRDANYQRAVALQKSLKETMAGLLDGKDVTYHFGGDLPVAIEVVRAIVANQLRSIGWDLVCIAILLLIVVRPLLGAAIVMIPVLMTDLLVFAFMGYVGLPIGIATSMFAAITIGVGVDQALHFFHNYHKHRTLGFDDAAALRATMAGTGRAIRWNTLVLAAGFLVLTASAVRPNRALGLLLSSAMLACYATTLLFLPGLLRRLRLVLVLACIVLVSPVHAADNRNPVSQPLSGEEILLRIQNDFMRIPRIARVEIATTYAQRGESDRVLWGVFSGQDRPFRILYVFTRPEVSRGTTLLMKLKLGGNDPDSTWFYLPSFHTIRRVDESAYRLVVPGTGLSYGDARGFIPVDQYDVKASAPPGDSGRTDLLFLTARPKTETLRKNMGYDSLAIWIDPQKMLLTRIDYTALDGKPLKRYEVLESVLVRDIWHAGKVRVDHFTEDLTSEMTYRFWPLAEPPADSLYEASLRTAPFLDRLRELLLQQGIDPDIETR